MQQATPSAWRLDFLTKKIPGFLIFRAKILAIILGKVRNILQYFSRSWREIVLSLKEDDCCCY